ncbi:Putative disease resistance protein RGA4 [Dendrobium catenatum]|uniref:Disease resistance protein RGA4 n=1 Tax=Dendrobium catenatum TaxID=906689 RepID=A0A2I0VKT9_9ASPA|nr:Putative disease resistance protein RGA4 [Dendrobium catenatum]
MQWLKRPSNEPRGAKDVVMWLKWLKRPSNEHRGTDLYRNISLLSIVGHGGMGKTTLLQHVYNDEITQEFDLKMWVSVSNNFDVKKVIADVLESLKKERPRLEKLVALQDSLRTGIMSKKFYLCWMTFGRRRIMGNGRSCSPLWLMGILVVEFWNNSNELGCNVD